MENNSAYGLGLGIFLSIPIWMLVVLVIKIAM